MNRLDPHQRKLIKIMLTTWALTFLIVFGAAVMIR